MPLKPFFRRHDRWWVMQMRQGPRRWQHKLCRGSPPRGLDTQAEAYDLFAKLMARGTELPPPTKVKVRDVLRAFLEYSAAPQRRPDVRVVPAVPRHLRRPLRHAQAPPGHARRRHGLARRPPRLEGLAAGGE